ncbi:MAG: hypothetical protein ACYCZ2_05660 [Lutibacter sp.]
MRFLLHEYISLLKEDGELDSLITDLLIGMNLVPLSKPQRGRQHGVDISAIGIDKEDGLKKVFLIAVKQGNLTRINWDSGTNSVRQTINEIKDTYVNIALSKKYQKLPKKVIVCTNGVMNQTVQIDWTQYINKNSENNLEFDFWGIGEISQMLDEYLITEKLFPEEFQSLLRKTLAFLDLPDYKMTHFYILIDKVFEIKYKQKKKVLKQMRLLRLCLSIIFKWSQDIENIKPSIYASERSILKCWDWLQKNELLDEKYIFPEFYKLHLLKREIGITFFNKVYDNYRIQHSIYRYSKNSLEYSLTIWEHIGILAIIGLTEMKEAQFNYASNSNKVDKTTEIYLNSGNVIAETLNHLIMLNPPSNYPEYDEHSIEIALALKLFYTTTKFDKAKDWIYALSVGISDAFVIKQFFPLFRTNYDKLVDIYNGNEKCDIQSSMLLTLLLEWSIVLDEKLIYDSLKKTINDNFKDVNLQLWFPEKETENILCNSDYSANSGSNKHSIALYEEMKDFKKEIIEEKEMFNEEKDFEFIKIGYDLIGHIASRHYRSQPLPIFWRSLMKNEDPLKKA